MTYTERPDVAFAGARAVNEAVYGGNVLMDAPQNFGVNSTPIYIYNIAKREFNVPRYPNHPRLFLRACPKDQEYLLVGQIEHPFVEFVEDTNQNKIPKYVDGFREAAKMLNPANPGIDQNFDLEDSIHYGDNLNAYGVFFSENNPPLPEELAAAKARIEKTYNKELKRMADIEARDPQNVYQSANSISHAAAEYFQENRSWHRLDLAAKAEVIKIDCGVCGEKIMPKAKICVHCGAPTDPEKQEKWLAAAETRRPRPVA